MHQAMLEVNMQNKGTSGKMGRQAERDAWTAFVDGKPAASPQRKNKYGNKKIEGFDSIAERDVAMKLRALAARGMIREYEEQKRIVIVEGDGHERAITYIADFYYVDDDGPHVLDKKGFRTQVYRLKRRLLILLHKIKIEEV
jgi:hypothetical protein